MSLNKTKLALAIAAGLTFSSGAFATNGIIQAGNGMVAHGLGGAGLSNAAEASSGVDNPALVTQTGDAVNVAWSMFMPDREFTRPAALGGTTEVSDSRLFAIPQVAFSSKINSDMSWGIMAYAMGGMNTDYRGGPIAGAGGPQSVNLQGMIIAPTLGYAINKNVSVGASLLIGYMNMTARNLFAPFITTNNTFDDTSVGYGVKLGIDAKVAEGISIGAMIQPQMQMDEFQGLKTFFNNFGSPFRCRTSSVWVPSLPRGKMWISSPMSCTTSGRAMRCSSSSVGMTRLFIKSASSSVRVKSWHCVPASTMASRQSRVAIRLPRSRLLVVRPQMRRLPIICFRQSPKPT